MHICVIGDGVAGLMAANLFASKKYVTKVTSIGSSKIPTIGVGESTTLNFERLHREFDSNFNSFISEADACVKLGVLYSNWSEKEFLHYFKNDFFYARYNTSFLNYSNTLANKNPNTYIHDLIGTKLFEDAKNNLIPNKEYQVFYERSWHFDAGKYILYLKKLLKHKKVNQIDDIVVDCKFKSEGSIEYITLESNQQIIADYYIISTGQNEITSKIFNIKYKDLSDILLTDKALFFPKKYKNKFEEIHPYTVAKTMKYGWRWITPTWSRIGTGYVFSSKYISVDEAIKEFQEDIGDSTVIPNVIDFQPRYNQKTFNSNYMTLGMCNGFLEPLDAPGLAISCLLTSITNLFLNDNKLNSKNIDKLNQLVDKIYLGWCSFILSQYKTCYRNDTNFWIDHKKIKFNYLDEIMENLYNDNFYDVYDPNIDSQLDNMLNNKSKLEIITMIQNTTSAKNIKWKTSCTSLPFKMDDSDYQSQSHYDFLKNIHHETKKETL